MFKVVELFIEHLFQISAYRFKICRMCYSFCSTSAIVLDVIQSPYSSALAPPSSCWIEAFVRREREVYKGLQCCDIVQAARILQYRYLA